MGGYVKDLHNNIVVYLYYTHTPGRQMAVVRARPRPCVWGGGGARVSGSKGVLTQLKVAILGSSFGVAR